MSRWCASLVVLVPLLVGTGCGGDSGPAPDDDTTDVASASGPQTYATVPLDAEVGDLSRSRQAAVSQFIEAAQAMDAIFWEQVYGNRDSLLRSIESPEKRRLVEINYGPWDRLNRNEPLLEEAGARPPGANFYPADVTASEVEQAAGPDTRLRAPNTMVRRLPDGSLTAIPYHTFFAESMLTAADRLRAAATRVDHDPLDRYLERRAEALTTGTYEPSTRAWTALGDSPLDLVIGPLDPTEDRLFGNKAAIGALVMRRNSRWSRRLKRYDEGLADRRERDPGSREETGPVDLGAYNVLYAAGSPNAGPTRTTVSVPANGGATQGAPHRRLVLVNALRHQFEEGVRPVTESLIAVDQRSHVTFDAAMSNVLVREAIRGVGAGPAAWTGGAGTMRPGQPAKTIEASSAHVRAVARAAALAADDAIETSRMDQYVTFVADLVHTIRLEDATGGAPVGQIPFTYLYERGAVAREGDANTYVVHPDSMTTALDALARELRGLSADDGAAARFVETYGGVPEALHDDLGRLEAEGIPVDVTYEQGRSVLQGMDAGRATP